MIFKKYGKAFLDQEIATQSHQGLSSLSTPYLSPHVTSFTPSQEEAIQHEKEEPIEEQPDVVIGEGVSFKGTLSFENLLRLDGSFEGTIEKGKKIIVGPKGVLKGNLQLDEAFIAGKIEGDLYIKERLILRSRAEVYGNITAPRLSVDEGVTIVGQLLVSNSTTPST
jgi:cytoskeletal protein CcmA (bactofilin family)